MLKIMTLLMKHQVSMNKRVRKLEQELEEVKREQHKEVAASARQFYYTKPTRDV